ncbi:Rieske (2Fe-2S) protein [Streptomyces sp. CRN 30]|uniref:Rieske (2Fe-2S) protein n=1 Tax=Streptomyces sp. CRN 30 TaxID=3075613 RepID=UPI002A8387C0|nr:Rieske (2Fe-2S) protein [Streptomyces sp. CRN 30]
MTPSATRRSVLLATGAVTLTTTATAACGGDGDDESSSSATSGPASDAASGSASAESLADTGDIPVGGGKVLKDEKVVVTQPEKGDFKAFSAVCTHQGCVVKDVSGSTINCACHGSKFAIADGSVKAGPATEPLPSKKITVDGNSITLA